MSETTKVGCRMPNGVRLRVTDFVDSPDGSGTRIPREIGTIDLPGPVSTHVAAGHAGAAPTQAMADVDAGLFKIWWSQNQDSSLVTSGMVFMPEPERPTAKKVEQATPAAPVKQPAKPDTGGKPA